MAEANAVSPFHDVRSVNIHHQVLVHKINNRLVRDTCIRTASRCEGLQERRVEREGN